MRSEQWLRYAPRFASTGPQSYRFPARARPNVVQPERQRLTAIDPVFFGVRPWALVVPGAAVLGLLAAVLSWVPI